MKSIRQFVWLGICMILTACGNSGTGDDVTESPGTAPETPVAPAVEAVEIIPGLSMRLLREGGGATAQAGQLAVVHYTGWLFDETAELNRGKKFDSSVDRGVHFEFPLGAGRVIRGWDEGVAGMKIGEIRELTIAPDLAYGNRQVGNLIPPGSTLIFEVELADLKGLDEAATTP
jgi:FKBP-type peptidyl-prolyl cis-trans isomerase FkpA